MSKVSSICSTVLIELPFVRDGRTQSHSLAQRSGKIRIFTHKHLRAVRPGL